MMLRFEVSNRWLCNRREDLWSARSMIQLAICLPERTPIGWDEALRLYQKEGWTYAEIAREFDYAYKTVHSKLRKLGTKRHPRSSSRVIPIKSATRSGGMPLKS